MLNHVGKMMARQKDQAATPIAADAGGGSVTSAPGTPDLAAASDTGTSSTDNYTSDTTPTFRVTLPAEAIATDTITLYRAVSTSIGTAVLDSTDISNGYVDITASTLAEATHSITATCTNGTGESAASSALSVTVDATAPSAPSAIVVAPSDQGYNTTQSHNPQPTMRVTLPGDAVSGDIVTLTLGGADDNTGTCDSTDISNGYIEIQINASQTLNAAYQIAAYITDVAGNVGSAISAATITIGFTDPADITDVALVLDASDISTLKQLIAGTTDVTTDGDPSGWWGDQSGNSFNLTGQANDSTRTTYNTADAPHVTFDGSTNRMANLSSLGLYAAGECTMSIGVRANPSGTGKVIIHEGLSTDNDVFYGMLGDGTTASIGQEIVRDTAATVQSRQLQITGAFDNTDRLFTLVDDGSNWTGFLDGSQIDTASYTRAGTHTANRFTLGAFWAGSAAGYMAMRVYALIIVKRAVGALERACVEAWVNARLPALAFTLIAGGTLDLITGGTMSLIA